ncbi:MAG: hypothetical protein A2V45_06715 [Candidatus Aminicenantes bacterium RBG_19FT_COMBO_58_17]|nr:MAG: hypothetical protein A2V45_06715 [Candidatus Aminicenantes bacterium RBG_19FT_COMBO_58_17]
MDPGFALAHAGMGNAYGNLGALNLAPPTEVMPKARMAIQRALELDDQLAEAHAQAANMAFYYEWDWAAADQSYQRAIAANPGYAAAHAWYAWNCIGSRQTARRGHRGVPQGYGTRSEHRTRLFPRRGGLFPERLVGRGRQGF